MPMGVDSSDSFYSFLTFMDAYNVKLVDDNGKLLVDDPKVKAGLGSALRDYTTPYRTLLPKEIDNLLVAGRHYSATSTAQKMSREIPPCMAMGEAAGVAAAMALDAGVRVRDVDVKRLQAKLRAQGADPGEQGGPNADVPAIARAAAAAMLQREAA